MKWSLIVFGLFSGLMGCITPPEKPLNNESDKKKLATKTDWKLKIQQKLKEYGHRNWIVVVDAAYPKQSNPAIKTMSIDASQSDAVAYISELVEKATHVDANIFVDKEIDFVTENDAPGMEAYRKTLDTLLKDKPVEPMLHEDIIKELDKSAELFDILVLKTNMTIPYTSVFFQLECGYWDARSEEALRSAME